MKVHILDDWFDTLMTLPSYARLSGHDVTIWNGHTKDVGVLAERLVSCQGASSISRTNADNFRIAGALANA